MSKNYVLFTDNELEYLKNGMEIEHTLHNGEHICFISEEGYKRKVDWENADSRLHRAIAYRKCSSKDELNLYILILLNGMHTMLHSGDRSEKLYTAIMKATKSGVLFPEINGSSIFE